MNRKTYWRSNDPQAELRTVQGSFGASENVKIPKSLYLCTLWEFYQTKVKHIVMPYPKGLVIKDLGAERDTTVGIRKYESHQSNSLGFRKPRSGTVKFSKRYWILPLPRDLCQDPDAPSSVFAITFSSDVLSPLNGFCAAQVYQDSVDHKWVSLSCLWFQRELFERFYI